MRRAFAAVLLAGLSHFPPARGAEDHVWIVGGGPFPDESQAQIEMNVNWVLETLRERLPGARLRVYYTDGEQAGRTIKVWQKPIDALAAFSPLARVFDYWESTGDQFRERRVSGDVRGSTEAGTLKQELAEAFAALKPGDKATLIYNGHGLRGENDASENTLRLWGDTRVSVRDLDRTMSTLDPGVPVRFIFAQCYSGGFLRLIRPEATDVRRLGQGNRCGFAAESEDRKSEGCSASIDVGDYRDYTTYFFSALRGQDRMGRPLAGSADRDGDGVVTPLEAHWYVLRYAYNADLPRSTSEMYLERWQPWYLRWVGTGRETDNVYGRMAAELAVELGLPREGRPLIKAMQDRRAESVRLAEALNKEKETLQAEVRRLQKVIRRAVTLRWPEAEYPYTANFVRFLRTDVDKAQEFILAQPLYSQLVQKQERLHRIELELVEADRDATRLDMVRRLRHLGRLLDQFERHGSQTAREEFARLTRCERLPL